MVPALTAFGIKAASMGHVLGLHPASDAACVCWHLPQQAKSCTVAGHTYLSGMQSSAQATCSGSCMPTPPSGSKLQESLCIPPSYRMLRVCLMCRELVWASSLTGGVSDVQGAARLQGVTACVPGLQGTSVLRRL